MIASVLAHYFGSAVRGWLIRLDPEGVGVVSAAEFFRRTRDLCSLKIRKEFVGEKERIVLEDVDMGSGQLILQFALLIQRSGGVKRVFADAMKNGPLTYDNFMHVILDLRFNLRSYRRLFGCLDLDQDGKLRMENISFLDRWRNKAYELSGTEALRRRLKSHAPVSELTTLIQRKAEVNAKAWGFELGHGNALMQAVERGTPKEVESLLKLRADPNAKDVHGVVPLHKLRERKVGRMAGSRAVNICELLITYRATVDKRTTAGQTPLHLACANNQPSLIAILCENRADVNAVDDQTRTPLWFSVYRNAFDACKCLVGAMADPCRNDRNDSTAMRYSIEYGRDEIAELLIAHLQESFELLVPSTLDNIVRSEDDYCIAKEVSQALRSYLDLGKIPPERVAHAIMAWANEEENDLVRMIVDVANEELRLYV